eukprot:1131485-Pyramimonas_sp.AAC.1
MLAEQQFASASVCDAPPRSAEWLALLSCTCVAGLAREVEFSCAQKMKTRQARPARRARRAGLARR